MEDKPNWHRPRGVMSIIERRFLEEKLANNIPPPPISPRFGFFCLEAFKDPEIWTSVGLNPPETFIEARIEYSTVRTWNGIEVIVPLAQEETGNGDSPWVEGYWCDEEDGLFKLGEKQLGRGNFGVKAVIYETKEDGEWLWKPTVEIAQMIYWRGNPDTLE